MKLHACGARACVLDTGAGDASGGTQVWATALAIMCLRGLLGGQAVEWGLMEAKALKWLGGQPGVQQGPLAASPADPSYTTGGVSVETLLCAAKAVLHLPPTVVTSASPTPVTP